jgi:hypothetical protein
MKFITSIILSVIFVVQAIMPNADICCEFQKISAQYAHFQEHKTFDGESFLDFVLEDFINNNGKFQEHHQKSNQQESPYHNVHQSCCSLFYFPPNQDANIEFVDASENQQFDHYTSFFSSAYLESLFQPPRV